MRAPATTTPFFPLAIALWTSACNNDVDSPSHGGPPPVGPASCSAGQVEAPGGGCMAVGVSRCADLFRDADGLCRPSVTRCDQGMIPKLDEGCIPVGITRCAEVFLGEDGLCMPRMAACPPGTFPVPAEGCVPIDGPDGCGTGAWGNIPAAPGNVYVDAAAPADGDGSMDRPVKTIAEALQRVARGGRVALAAGVYDEAVEIQRPIELVGRCPSMVRIQGSTPIGSGYSVAVRATGARGVTVRNVEIGGPGIGIIAAGRASLTVERVHIRRATANGLFADGASSISASHVLVDEMLPQLPGAGEAFGAQVDDGSVLQVRASAFVGSRLMTFLSLGEGSVIEASGVLIEGTAPATPDAVAAAVAVGNQGRVTIEESALIDSETLGLFAQGPGTLLDAKHNTVVGTRSFTNGIYAGAVTALAGAAVSLEGNVIASAERIGVYAHGSSTNLSMRGDLVASSSLIHGEPPRGFGAIVDGGARLSLDGVSLFDHATALTCLGNGALDVSASLIEKTISEHPGVGGGFGLYAEQCGELAVRESIIAETASVGLLLIGGPGAIESSSIRGSHEVAAAALSSDARLSGILIEGTLPRQDNGEFGAGLLSDASRLEIRDTLVRDSHVGGLMITGASTVTVSRLVVDDVPSGTFKLRAITPLHGIGDGVLVMEQSTVSLSHCQIQGCSRAGMFFDSSSGAVDTTVSTQNRFGMVLQGPLSPTIGDGVVADDNTERATVVGGDLPIPSSPLPLPP